MHHTSSNVSEAGLNTQMKLVRGRMSKTTDDYMNRQEQQGTGGWTATVQHNNTDKLIGNENQYISSWE